MHSPRPRQRRSTAYWLKLTLESFTQPRRATAYDDVTWDVLFIAVCLFGALLLS